MAGLDGAKKLVAKMQKKYPERHIEAIFIDKDDSISMTDGITLNPVQ